MSLPDDCDAFEAAFNRFLQPSPDQLLRVAIAVGFHRGRLRSVYQVLRGRDLATGQFIAERREQQFERLRNAQAMVLDLKHWHLFLNILVAAGFRSNEMISAETAVLYGYAYYLIGKLQYAGTFVWCRSASWIVVGWRARIS